MLEFTLRKKPEISLSLSDGGLRNITRPIPVKSVNVNALPVPENSILNTRPVNASVSVQKPQGIVTQSTAKTQSSGLQTPNRAGNILPSTDSPESFARGLNAVTEQYQPTRGAELTQSLNDMAARSTARRNRQTGLQFQTLLGQTGKGGLTPKASPTSTAWFEAMSDAEKTRAASIRNPVERGKFINSLGLNTRAVERLREGQDKTAAELESKPLQRTENAAGAAIAAYVQAGGDYQKRFNALDMLDAVGKRSSVNDLTRLDEQQKATIEKFAQAGDYQAVADYFDNIEYRLRVKSREALVEKSKETGYEHPVLSIVPEGTSNAFGGIPAVVNTVMSKLNETFTGEWTPIDPNSHVYDFVASSQAIQEGTNERIREIENPYLRGAARMGRSAASSALTNGLQLLAGSAAGLEGEALSNFVLGTMGFSAAGQSAYRDLKEGKTSGDALNDAIATGIIETLTEKVSLDRFVKGLPELRADNAKQLAINFWNMVKFQAPIEGLEEVTGNILDQMWGISYSGEDSEFSRRSQAVLAQKILDSGDPEHYKPTAGDAQSAREQAFMDLFVTQSAEAFATAALSSFMMVGAPTVTNGVDIARTRRVDVRAGNQLKRVDGAVIVEINKGKLIPGSEAARLAETLDAKIDRTNRDTIAKSVASLVPKDIGKLERLNALAVIEALGDMTNSENPAVKDYATELAGNWRQLQNKNLTYEGFRRILEVRDNNALDESVLPTASDEAKTNAAQAEQTQEENPDAVVLSPLEQALRDGFGGMTLRTVRKRAAILQRIIDGKDVTTAQFNSVDPANPVTKRIFSELTGVQFAPGVTGDALYNEYRKGARQNVEAVMDKARQDVTAESAQITEPVLVQEPAPVSENEQQPQAPAPVETPPAIQQEATQPVPQPQPAREEPLPVWDEKLADEVRRETGKIFDKGGQYGKGDVAYTPGNQPVNFRYAVVPVESLVISNDEYGTRNPDYPKELQPRNRERMANQRQIQDLAKTLNPFRLSENREAKDGAPIVRNDGVVIGGNGRSAAIRAAYQTGYGAGYENFIRGNAESFGLDPSQIPNNPVLVRVVADNDTDWARLAKDLNVATTHAYSPAETALSDTERIEDIIPLLNVGEDGNMNTSKNADFINAFVSMVPQSEQDALLDEYGEFSKTGLQRATNAVVAYVYDDARLLARYTESAREDMKNITNALVQTAPKLAQLKLDMQSGDAYNVPVIETILNGLNLYAESKRNQQTVQETADQASLDTHYDANSVLVGEVIEHFKLSAVGLRGFLTDLADAVRNFGSPNQPSLMGGVENANIESALDTAAARTNERKGTNFQRGEGQFGGQSVSGTETSRGRIAERPDVSGDSASIAQDVREGMSQDDRAKFSETAQPKSTAPTSETTAPAPEHRDYSKWENEFIFGEQTKAELDRLPDAEEKLDELARETRKFKAEVTDFFGTIADAPVMGEISGKAKALAEYWREFFKRTLDSPDVFVNDADNTLDWNRQLSAGTRDFLVQRVFNGLTSSYPDFIYASFTLDLDNVTIRSMEGARLLFDEIRAGHFDDIHKHFTPGMPQTIVDSIDKMYSFENAYQNAKQATIESLYGYVNELKDSEKKRAENVLLKVKKGNSITEAERIHNAIMNGAEATASRNADGAVAYFLKTDGVKKPERLSKVAYDFALFTEDQRSQAMDAERNPTITASLPDANTEEAESALPEGVGAASYAFNNDAVAAQLEYNAEKYGTIEGQEKIDERGRVDNVYTNEIPAQMNDETYVGRNIVTQMSSPGIAKERIGDYEEGTVEGYFNENPLTHKDMLDKASTTMKRLGGVEESRKYLMDMMNKMRPLSLEDIALFQKTLVQLSHTEMSTQDYLEFAAEFSHYASYLGHGLNLLKLLKKIDPDYEMNTYRRTVRDINRGISEKRRGKIRNQDLPDMEKAEQAVEEAREEVLDDMKHSKNVKRRQRWMGGAEKIITDALKQGKETTPKSPRKRSLDAEINTALREIGVKMSGIIREGNPQKETVAKRIADMLIQKYGVSQEDAQRVGEIVVERFNELVAERSRETLEKMFMEKKASGKAKNQDHILKQFSDLANLGAFSSSDYAEQAAAKIFGYNYIRVNQTLIDEFRNAQTDEQRDKIIGRIQQDIADQIEPTLYEKYTALRYLGMLGSLKTIFTRNPGGNLFFQPVVGMKNVIAAGIESGAKALGIDIERTRAATYRAEDYQAWFDDFGSIKSSEASKVRKLILQGGKYSDNRSTNEFMRGIQDRRTIFGRNNDIVSKTVGRGLEVSRRAVTDWMDLGDAFFARRTYAATAARYLKAQGVTFKTASDEQLEAAREIAVREAAEATYRDNNQFAEAISRLGRNHSDNEAAKVINILLEGILPFRKTPANIAVRAAEYSPLGLFKTLYDTITKFRGSNKIIGNDLINEWAKLLTGTGLFLLGAFLKRHGMFGVYVTGTGALDERKKRGFMRLQGWQEYSLKFKIGNEWRYYNADWLAPEAIPVFLGANFAEASEDKDLNIWDAAKVAGTVADPVINMSMLSGLNKALDEAATYGKDDEYALVKIVSNAFWSNFTQAAVPQIVKQGMKAIDGTRKTTFIDRNESTPPDVQRLIGGIPYTGYHRIDYIDEWGRTQESYKTAAGNAVAQILSPAYQSTQEIGTDVSRTENELLSLYERTKDSGVLPSTAKTYFTLNGQRKDMTQAEYISYATQRGQTAILLSQQLTDSDAYKALSDNQKISAVKGVYDYANQMAKVSIWGDADNPELRYTPDSWVDEANALTQNGIAVHEYIIAKAIKSKATSATIQDSDGESVKVKVSYRKLENGTYHEKTSEVGSASVQAALEIRRAVKFSGSDAEKKYKLLFKNLDIAESVHGKNEQWLEKKLGGMQEKGSVTP